MYRGLLIFISTFSAKLMFDRFCSRVPEVLCRIWSISYNIKTLAECGMARRIKLEEWLGG